MYQTKKIHFSQNLRKIDCLFELTGIVIYPDDEPSWIEIDPDDEPNWILIDDGHPNVMESSDGLSGVGYCGVMHHVYSMPLSFSPGGLLCDQEHCAAMS